MKRIVLLLLAAYLPLAAQADIVRDLHRKSATKFDIAASNMLMLSMNLSDTMKGERIEDTKFKMKTVLPLSQEILGIHFVAEARSKYLSQQSCEIVKLNLSKYKDISIVKHLVTGLTDSEYIELSKSIVFRVTLKASDNEQLNIHC